MKFRNINEGSDRKFRPGPKTRAEYRFDSRYQDPLTKDVDDRNLDRVKRLDRLKNQYFENTFAKVAESFDSDVEYHDIMSLITYKVDKALYSKLVNSLIISMSTQDDLQISTGMDPDDDLYIIDMIDRFYSKTLANPNLSLTEFKKFTDEYANKILNTIKKITGIINSNAKIHFNTESFKERLNNSIKLVSESNNIESKVASKKNGKEAYKEYLELQEVFRNYAGKFLDLLGVDNSVTKILLKTQIDLGTAFTSEFNDTEEKKPEIPNTNPPPTPPAK